MVIRDYCLEGVCGTRNVMIQHKIDVWSAAGKGGTIKGYFGLRLP